MSKSSTFDTQFSRPVISIGKWTLLLAIPMSFIPVIYLGIRYGAWPPISSILTAWFLVASVYGVEYFMTPISYYPILGNSGTYMAFLSGNIANVRVPTAMVAQEAVGVKAGTKAGEIIATLGMGGSIISGLIITTLAAFAGTQIISVLPDSVMKAFDYVLPAIFGALFALFAIKFPKYAAFAITLAVILVYGFPALPTVLVVPMCSFGTIAFAMFLYRRNKANGTN